MKAVRWAGASGRRRKSSRMPLEALSEAVLQPANSLTLDTTHSSQRGVEKAVRKPTSTDTRSGSHRNAIEKRRRKRGERRMMMNPTVKKEKGEGYSTFLRPFFFYIYLHGLKQVFFLFFFCLVATTEDKTRNLLPMDQTCRNR